jgi:simple sugar transport system permease protein
MATATVAAPVVSTGYWTRSRKGGALFVVLGVAATIVFGAITPSGVTAHFLLGTTSTGASLGIPGKAGAIAFGIVATAAGIGLLISRSRRWDNWLVGAALVALLMSLLCYAIASASVGNQFIPVTSLAQQTIALSVPLIYGAMAGVLCERSGVINVAIEGQLLLGAFAAAMFATVAATPWMGVVAGGVAGMLVGALLAVFAIRYRVDQVILGVILIGLCTGLSGFLYERIMQNDSSHFNSPQALPVWEIPGLSKIPVIGPSLFKQNVLVYLVLILVAVIHIGLFRTRWGLRVRAVGEHPTAADTVGVRVQLVRYRNVILAGIVAGLGGAYLVLEVPFSFSKGMSAGKGFIALAAMIFGRWSPIGALLAALLFGFVDAFQGYLNLIGFPIPSQFLSMAPYLVTIVAVAGLVGRVRAPAADGKPYVKG